METAEKGTVYLVGAGPGDPGLLTLRARELITSCDVLAYDYLLSPTILDWVKAECETICVGKREGFHSMPQAQIQDLLVAHASDSKSVVRLKGGDPLVFGRGGEEIRKLKASNIPFKVIPGVTAALAGAAQMNLPLTDRNFSSGVIFLTGHEDPEKPNAQIDWSQYAKLGMTLCLYMSRKHLPDIVASLQAGGMSPQTPAAAIQWASMPQEKSVNATLETLVQSVDEAKIGTPTMFIIGQASTEPTS